MSYVSLVAIGFTTIIIAYLCLNDPKRRRAAQDKRGVGKSSLRRMLAIALCLPGVFLICVGDVAGFLNWLGGCAIVGWLVTLSFGAFSTTEPRQSHDGR